MSSNKSSTQGLAATAWGFFFLCATVAAHYTPESLPFGLSKWSGIVWFVSLVLTILCLIAAFKNHPES
jgi:hypothetical protein